MRKLFNDKERCIYKARLSYNLKDNETDVTDSKYVILKNGKVFAVPSIAYYIDLEKSNNEDLWCEYYASKEEVWQRYAEKLEEYSYDPEYDQKNPFKDEKENLLQYQGKQGAYISSSLDGAVIPIDSDANLFFSFTKDVMCLEEDTKFRLFCTEQEKEIYDTREYFRQLLANTTKETKILCDLSYDECSGVRLAVFNNIHTPKNVLERLYRVDSLFEYYAKDITIRN